MQDLEALVLEQDPIWGCPRAAEPLELSAALLVAMFLTTDVEPVPRREPQAETTGADDEACPGVAVLP